MTTRPLFDHRVMGAERKLRLGLVPTKHRTPPSGRYVLVRHTLNELPAIGGALGAISRPGATPTGRPQKRAEAPWG
jgi:hypothetical protein